jgi:membrane-bound lytic murein transglycosylase B
MILCDQQGDGMRKWLAAFAAAAAMATGTAKAEPADFERWLESFRAEAAAAGISAEVLDEALTGLSVETRVYELNDNQPEFSRAIWDYLDSAVSAKRIETGQTRFLENRRLLTLIEEAYGVDAEIISAIWGLESSYGAIMGDYDAIQALAP